jgi:two-component system phosphate regulon response regulator PhoB
MSRILVVEDEADLREMIGLQLEKIGHECVLRDGQERDPTVYLKENPDLLLVDWMLPGPSGLDIIRALRARPEGRDIAIILITARALDEDIVRGLEAGADDYVIKPVPTTVLRARVQAQLRRKHRQIKSEDDTLESGTCRLSPSRAKAWVDGQELTLSLYEFKVLEQLLRRPEKVHSRRELLESVKGDVVVVERTVDNHILGLRKKLGPMGDRIETVRGIGYRLRGED